jgi:hypothetical protein
MHRQSCFKIRNSSGEASHITQHSDSHSWQSCNCRSVCTWQSCQHIQQLDHGSNNFSPVYTIVLTEMRVHHVYSYAQIGVLRPYPISPRARHPSHLVTTFHINNQRSIVRATQNNSVPLYPDYDDDNRTQNVKTINKHRNVDWI